MTPPPPAAPLLLRGALGSEQCERWLTATASNSEVSRSMPQLSGLDAAQVLRVVACSALRGPIERTLGPAPLCKLGQSWLRHGRPPHSWHQDGALRFDFVAHGGRPLPTDALLEMLTCWIPLTPCGDHAPGLEWVDAALSGLLQPPELTDAAVALRFADAPRRRPSLQPGDVLLFGGHVLHRTHLTASMSQPRTSLELRFFRAGRVPARVAGDDFLQLR